MTFDITPIVEAVVAVVCAVVTCVLIPYIKSKTTTEQQKEINAWVKIAVSAAVSYTHLTLPTTTSV